MHIRTLGLPFPVSSDESDDKAVTTEMPIFNPLVQPSARWYELNKRVKLFPWWMRYNFGITKESILKDKIIEISKSLRLEEVHPNRIIRHAISEFSKNGLGSDYIGYHNINHELEVAYFTLLAAKGGQGRKEDALSQNDIKTLFVAALFHDYDPLKRFDKPHEDDVESFIRNDKKLKQLLRPFKINLYIVIALIHRTAYPFEGAIAEHSQKRIGELLSEAGISENDFSLRKHYEELGAYLSVCDRISGYCLGNFEYAQELARLNAHAMAWHPRLINERSVNYFTALKKEKVMLDRILQSIPEDYRKNFYDNVAGFRQLWENEVEIRAKLRRKEMNLVTRLETSGNDIENNLVTSVMKIYKDVHTPLPISQNEKDFHKSLLSNATILITLRTNKPDGELVGYVKGGPLEKYKLRRGTVDENFGKHNSIYMEWIRIKPEYWGETGGHILRSSFMKEARDRGYKFLSSYVLRDVITKRINNGESLEIVQRYDPDKLDYYRADLSKLIEIISVS